MVQKHIFSLLKDIRFWIIFFLLIRLVGIINPPLEIGHSWRQVLTNMVSRNMLEINPSLLFPRIDMDGTGTGIIGSEFPIFNFLSYLWFKIFGFSHWAGRLINLVVSSVGVYYFYKIIKRYFKVEVAFSATFILIVSGWFGFSRKIMPDTFSVSLLLIGLYYATVFLDKWRRKDLFLFAFFAALGALSKMPSVSILAVLAIPVLSSTYPIKQKLELIGTGVIVMLIMGLWYFYWVPHLLDTYGYKLFFPRDLLQGLKELVVNWFDTLDKFFFASFFSFIAFFFFLKGLINAIKDKNKLILISLSLISLVFLFYMMKTGDVFSFHSYYIIPFTPIMALIAGYGLSKLKAKWVYLLLLFISVESIANQYNDFFIKDEQKCKLNYELIADEFTNKDDLVIVTGGMDPITMYYLHRKGWSVYNSVLNDSTKMNEMHRLGANYIFVDKRQFSGNINLKLVKQTKCMDVYTFRD